MAGPRMNAGVLRAKVKVFDELHQEFKEKLAAFAKQVKTKMETTSAGAANKCLEIALVFLTQAFPNMEDTEQAEMESDEGRLDFDEKFKEIESKLEAKFEDHLRDIGKRQEQIEADLLKVGKEQVKFDDKLEQCNKETKRNMKEFDDKLKTCDKAIREIRADDEESKKNMKEESKTTTSPQQMPTTTASTSSPQVSTTSTSASTVQSFGASAAAAPLSGAPLSLSQTSHFNLQVRDNETLSIEDVKLVSSTLLLVTDVWNKCVRLFDIKGQELDTLKCQRELSPLTILTEKAPNCWSVAVLFPRDSSIGLLEINEQTLSIKSVINTQQRYHTIAAVSSTTLAAGSFDGVDLIDISGNILRSICSGVNPWCMVTTEDQCLIVLDGRKQTFNKFNLQQIERKICEIIGPRSIACVQSGSFVVADKVLHLVGDVGQYKRILWKLPSGGDDDDDDYLSCVTIHNNVCLCCTYYGSVYVFNVQGDQINKSKLSTLLFNHVIIYTSACIFRQLSRNPPKTTTCVLFNCF